MAGKVVELEDSSDSDSDSDTDTKSKIGQIGEHHFSLIKSKNRTKI